MARHGNTPRYAWPGAIHEAILSGGVTVGSLSGALIVHWTGDLRAPFWYGLIPILLAWIACRALGHRDRSESKIYLSKGD